MGFLSKVVRIRSPGTFFLRLTVLSIILIVITYHFDLIFSRKPRVVPPFFETHEFHAEVIPRAQLGWSGNGQQKPACIFPFLNLKDSAIMKFYKYYPQFECDPEPDWVRLHKGKFLISSKAKEKHGNITCDAFPITRVSDFKTKEEKEIKNIQNETDIPKDFMRVECKAADEKTYRNFHAGIHVEDDVSRKPRPPAGDDPRNGLGLDVVMMGMDSTSHLAWMRHLPKTRDYFLNVLHGTEMWGYNILGDGTPATIMPVLTGKREEELPEARRGYKGAKAVDQFPWIWDQYKKKGYVTAWGEDDASLGTFTYRLTGFTEKPVDHYMREFGLAIEPRYSQFKPFCLGSTPRHKVFFNYFLELFDTYPADTRKWAFLFQSELSHKDNNHLSRQDEAFVEYMESMRSRGHLENAIFILMADHGARFSKVRATAQGKQEERLPYLAISLPQWFREKNPDIVKNLETNAQRLVTPFDIHETFLEILNFTGAGKADISRRGVSLFKAIPVERGCESAGVDPHWCACMDWKEVALDSDIVSRLTIEAINTLNHFTDPYRSKCAVLNAAQVVSVAEMKAKDAVLKFKDTNDGGRGRFGKMTDTTKHSKILYQITFTTVPGEGRFEVTITHQLENDQLTLDKKDISRTNLYGQAPHCVEKEEPFLRPYCYCKDLL